MVLLQVEVLFVIITHRNNGVNYVQNFVEMMEAVRHVTPFRKKPEKMWVLAYQAHFYVCTDCARSGALQKPALGVHIMGITGNDVEKKITPRHTTGDERK